MKTTDYDQDMAIFNQAAENPLEGHDAEWIWLVREVLRLPIYYLPAVYDVLRQGRWRAARRPKAYIKTAASREALKKGLVDKEPEELGLTVGPTESAEGYIGYLLFSGTVRRGNGVWCVQGHPEDDRVNVDEEGRQLPTINGKPVPECLVSLEDDEPDAQLIIDWSKVGRQVPTDEQEQCILELRALGQTREAILASAESDEERLELQAAWRRLDRKMPRIREVLQGGKD